LAGLGKPVQFEGNNDYKTMAWSASTGASVELPVYQQWRFVTDELEDLELLVRRLKPVSADYAGVNQSFSIESALKKQGTPIPATDTDPPLMAKMVDTLNDVIAESEEDAKGEDPLVAFPAYGFRFKPETDVSSADAKTNKWFDKINLDLRYRHVAGLGVRLVRENQEVFSHICWQQYEEVVAANEKLAALQVSQKLAENLVDRHFAKLASDVALTLAEPLLPFVQLEKTTVTASLRENGVPSSFVTRNLRRQAAKRPVASKTVDGHNVVPTPAVPGDSRVSNRIKAEKSVDRPAQDELLVVRGLSVRAAHVVSPLFKPDSFDQIPRLKAQQTPVKRYSSSKFTKALSSTLRVLPNVKAKFTVGGLNDDERQSITPVWRSPVITNALADQVVALAPDRILSGANGLPQNSISLFEENRAFIEAFLVGANHAMNEELRWREFPTDLRGTIFRHFWNQGNNAAASSSIGPGCR